MKQLTIIHLIILFLTSCTGKTNSVALENLNGYWEITKVSHPEKNDITYTVNTYVDLFSVDSSNTGFRKKLKVDFFGNYTGNNIQEKISIFNNKNNVTINYLTSESNWIEKIIKLTNKELILQHENGTNYHYKKHEKLTVE